MDSVEIIYKDSMRPDSSDEAGHELAAHFASETAATDHTVVPHSDLYEQIDQLAAIDIDEIIKLQADDANAVTTHPVLYADFFEGLAQLATMGVVEVTEIVEAIHREVILRPLGRFNENHLNNWQRGITGRIYGTIRQVMLLVGNNLATVLRIYKTMMRQTLSRCPIP